MSDTPIAEHAFLSDRHTSALVDSQGSVVWLTAGRFDGPAVFARILDDDAGHWSVRPAGAATSTRRYVDGSLVLETTFAAEAGTVVVTDALALGTDDGGHRVGRDVPHLLVRRVTCTEGAVEVETVYRPRPEFGLVSPLLAHTAGGVTARGGADWLVLSTPHDTTLADGEARARVTMHAGDTVHLGLQRSTLEQKPAHVWSEDDLRARLDATIAAWQAWAAEHQSYEGPWADLVHHSGRVLEGLSFQPSGAVIAAPTTSLPEAVGGGRNWDYHYSWIRDASFTMEALWVAACPDEAEDYFAFMTTAAAASMGPDRDAQIVFGLGGERDLSERELGHLAGWRGSAPVRVGNGAWNQRQIDVYGELLGAAHRLADQLTDLDDDTRRFLVACADAAAAHWRDPDRGIWEVRGEPRQFVYSKVMCWVALDRAIALAPQLGAEEQVPDWTRHRDEIHREVVASGWNGEVGAFTQYFGGTALDAANLVLPIVGFLPPDDERVVATVEAVADRLTDRRGLVYRYRTGDGVDGLEGDEGTFLLCTFWLAHALALCGQVDRAREVFERAVGHCNDVGLLAEEVDVETGELLGNFPQAFSHVGLVNAAWAIAQAAERQDRDV